MDNSEVLDLVDLTGVTRVAMIGAIAPCIEQLSRFPWLRLNVVDKKSEALDEKTRRFCVPLEQTPRILADCDVALITGAAIANGTIDSLLGWVSPDACVIVVGPTASFAPDALFRKGVSLVGGVVVKEPDLAIDMISEGGLAYHLFGRCLQKVNMINTRWAAGGSVLLRKPPEQGSNTFSSGG